MNESESRPRKNYKIIVGDTITVFKQEAGKHTFYKTPIAKKNYDGTTSYYNKRLWFKKDVDIPNNSKIKVLDFFEEVRENYNDKYNPTFGLFILDYELIDKNMVSNSINAYNMQISEQDKISDIEKVEVSDDDLPF